MGTKHSLCPTHNPARDSYNTLGWHIMVILKSQLNISSEFDRTSNYEEWIKFVPHINFYLSSETQLDSANNTASSPSPAGSIYSLQRATSWMGNNLRSTSRKALFKNEVKATWPTGPSNCSHATFPLAEVPACLLLPNLDPETVKPPQVSWAGWPPTLEKCPSVAEWLNTVPRSSHSPWTQ